MIRPLSYVAVLIVALLALFGCNNSSIVALSSSTAHGALEATPVRTASLSASQLSTILNSTTTGAQLLTLAGTPKCGVDIYYIHYWTLGGAQEVTNSSGALMVPTGGVGCSGPRPIVLYAHGTAYQKQYNIANFSDRRNPAATESALVASMYAAQGFIVVAPNYAGYDVSTLPYHPYINAVQQSGEMIDALAAGRAALPTTIGKPSSDNGQLLLAGYSQGGYVAMATMKAMQAQNMPVTAIAAGSGPYALEAFGDAIVGGSVNLGSTVLGTLVVNSYQKAYGNIYATPTDLYSTHFAPFIETLLPTKQSIGLLFATGLLPVSSLLNSATPTVDEVISAGVPSALAPELAAAMTVPANALFAAGFGSDYLINNSYRINYVFDAATNPDAALAGNPSAGLAAAEPSINSLRKAFYRNDMRNGGWAPASSMFLCGGSEDPTVYFNNSQIMQQYWSNFDLPAGLITLYNVDPTPNITGDELQTGFVEALTAIRVAAGVDGDTAALQAYHSLVGAFCTTASRDFFANVLSTLAQ